jgi:hypothetical protein
MKLKTFLIFVIVFIIFSFSTSLSSFADAYDDRMSAAFRNSDVNVMKKMLEKGAKIPDVSTGSVVKKSAALLEFMIDNGYKPDRDGYFKALFSFTPLKDRKEKFDLFFEKGYFPTTHIDGVRFLSFAADGIDPSSLSEGFFTNAEFKSIQDELIVIYKELLLKTKELGDFYNPAFRFLRDDDAMSNDLVQYILDNFSVYGIDNCQFSLNDLHEVPTISNGLYKFSALQMAALTGRYDMVKILLNKKADVNRVCSGMTVMDYLDAGDDIWTDNTKNIASFLLERGAKKAKDLKAK